MRSIKILNVSSLYPPKTIGGAERVARTLNMGLKERGHRIDIVTLDPDSNSTTSDDQTQIHYRKLKNFYWPFDSKNRSKILKFAWHALNFYNPLMARSVDSVIAETQPDVMLCHNIDGFSPSLWKLASRHGLPIVQVIHDLGTICPKRTMYRAGHACTKICGQCSMMTFPSRLLANEVNTFVYVSHALKKLMEQSKAFGEHPGPSVVIHNPLDPNACPKSQPDHLTISRSIRLGYVGRIEPVKGIELLVSALDTLGDDRPQLQIAGRGSPAYQHELIQRYPWLAGAFIGFQEPAVAYANIDVLIAPSLIFEGLGIGPLEARRFGVPSLVAEIGGLPEVVEPGKTGWLFHQNDRSSLLEKIRWLCSNPEQIRASKKACLQDDWRARQTTVFDQYQEVLVNAANSRSK